MNTKNVATLALIVSQFFSVNQAVAFESSYDSNHYDSSVYSTEGSDSITEELKQVDEDEAVSEDGDLPQDDQEQDHDDMDAEDHSEESSVAEDATSEGVEM